MKLKEYMRHLNKLTKDNPEALEMDVVTSSDDEGNEFVNVFYMPSVNTFGDGKEKQVCLN